MKTKKKYRSKSTKSSSDIVIEQILNMVNTDLPPWQMPFTQDLPINFKTKNKYQGSNFYMLSIFAQLLEVRNKWMTYLQAKDLGLQFSHEAAGHGIKVIHCNYDEDPDTLLKVYKGTKVSTVFSIDYLVNPPSKEEVGLLDPILTEPQFVIDNLPFRCLYTEESGSAFYSPRKHLVNVPPDSDFKVAAEKYAVKFHEFSHATGHHTLLNRFAEDYQMPSKGEYSEEELNAEFSTMFCCAATGISRETEINSLAYSKGWWERIKKDPDVLLKCISVGQTISNYMMNIKHVVTHKDNPEE